MPPLSMQKMPMVDMAVLIEVLTEEKRESRDSKQTTIDSRYIQLLIKYSLCQVIIYMYMFFNI